MSSGYNNFERLTQTGENETTVKALGSEEAGLDRGSQSSQTQIIKETRTFAIESSSPADKDRKSFFWAD